MIENCILIFGIAVSIALYFIFWMLFIVADELRGIRDELKGIGAAVSGDTMREVDESDWNLALELARPYHNRKPGLEWHYIYTTSGRMPVYIMRITESIPEVGQYTLATSDQHNLLRVVAEWNRLVEDQRKKEAKADARHDSLTESEVKP